MKRRAAPSAWYRRFMAQAAARRRRALELKRAGHSYAEIGAKLGCSRPRAFELVQRAKLDFDG